MNSLNSCFCWLNWIKWKKNPYDCWTSIVLKGLQIILIWVPLNWIVSSLLSLKFPSSLNWKLFADYNVICCSGTREMWRASSWWWSVFLLPFQCISAWFSMYFCFLFNVFLLPFQCISASFSMYFCLIFQCISACERLNVP